MHQAAPRELTSTQKIRTALDNVMGITVRERELDDKQSYSDEPLTATSRPSSTSCELTGRPSACNGIGTLARTHYLDLIDPAQLLAFTRPRQGTGPGGLFSWA